MKTPGARFDSQLTTNTGEVTQKVGKRDYLVIYNIIFPYHILNPMPKLFPLCINACEYILYLLQPNNWPSL